LPEPLKSIDPSCLKQELNVEKYEISIEKNFSEKQEMSEEKKVIKKY